MRTKTEGLTVSDLIEQMDDLQDQLDAALEGGDGTSASELLSRVVATAKLISWMNAGWVVGPTASDLLG